MFAGEGMIIPQEMSKTWDRVDKCIKLILMETNVKKELLSMEEMVSMSGGIAVLSMGDYADGAKASTATNAANCAFLCGLSNNCFPCVKK